MSILICGGAGYIGSHTVLALLNQGRKVVVLDNLSTGHRAAVDSRAIFYQGDIHDCALLHTIMEQESIDAVIHFAAYSLVAESMRDPLKYYQNNLCGTETLLEVMLAHRVDKIVFSSTAATYGEPNCVPILENAPTQPTNPYGATKLAMEQMFFWAGQAHPLRFVSLRYFNACGAESGGHIGEDHSPESHLIPLILQVPNGQRDCIQLFGTDYPTPDGTCIRDYIHVSDLAQAHIRALTYLEQGGTSDIFNLGNGIGFSVREVVDCARRITGHPIPALESPRRAGDPAKLIASSEKAKRILGWQPQFPTLDDIISSAWTWHKTHPHGYTDKNSDHS